MKFFSMNKGEDAIINFPQMLDTFIVSGILGGAAGSIASIPKASNHVTYSNGTKSIDKNTILTGTLPESGTTFVLADENGNPIVYSEPEAALIASESEGVLKPESVAGIRSYQGGEP